MAGKPMMKDEDEPSAAKVPDFDNMLDGVKRAGLPAYAKAHLSSFYAGYMKEPQTKPNVERMLGWISKNPQLLSEFENDFHSKNITVSPENQIAPAKEKFNSMLGLWIGTKYLAAGYREQKPENEFKKMGNLTICSERMVGGIGPSAIVHVRKAEGTPERMNFDLASLAYPWLREYGHPDTAPHGRLSLFDLQDQMKKPAFDTDMYAQYLMRLNNISSPEVRDKISNIFLRLGAIVKDNPKLAFSDFIGSFVVEMNHEFGSNLVFAKHKRIVRSDGKKPANISSVPKKTSSGGGKPPGV